MDKHDLENYISLQEATKLCKYSQEYLSLRARQGKLKSAKFGRNWVTKKEWLDEYLAKVDEYNNSLKISRRRVFNFLRGKKKFVPPPENLPVEKMPALRFGFVIALAFVLLAANGIFALRQAQGNPEFTEWIGKESFKNVYETLDPYVGEISQAGDRVLAVYGESFKTAFPAAKDFYYGVFGEADAAVRQIGEASDLAAKEISGSLENVSSLWAEGGEIVISSLIPAKWDEVKKRTQFSSPGIESTNNFLTRAFSLPGEFSDNFNRGVAIEIKNLKFPEVKALLHYGAGKIKNLANNMSSYTYIVGVAEEEIVNGIGEIVSDAIFSGGDSFANAGKAVQDFYDGLSMGLNVLGDKISDFGYRSADIGEINGKTLIEYGDWLLRQPSVLAEKYNDANNFVEGKLGNFVKTTKEVPTILVQGYNTANDFIEEKLSQGYQAITKPFVSAYQFVTAPWRVGVPEKVVVEEKAEKEKLEALQNFVRNIISNGVSGYTAANDFAEQKLGELSQAILNSSSALARNYSSANDFVEKELSSLEEKISNTATNTTRTVLVEVEKVKDYGKRTAIRTAIEIAQGAIEVGKTIKEIPSTLVRGYNDANKFVEGKLGNFVKTTKEVPTILVQGYNTANDFIEEKLNQGYQAITKPFVSAYQFVTAPWRVGAPEKVVVEEKAEKEKLEALQGEFKKLKEEGIIAKEIIKEVSKITQIEPIKEITKEILKETIITKVGPEALRDLQSQLSLQAESIAKQAVQISGLQSDMARRPTGFISSPSIIQPVSQQANLTKLYAENGQVALETSGSGNIVLSAAGNVIISGTSISLGGSVALSAPQTITGSSDTLTMLTVTQNGLGNIVDFKDGGTTVFSIADGGYATLAVDASTTPSFLIKGLGLLDTFASSTYFGIIATSSFDGRFIDLIKDGISVFYIDSSGNLVLVGDTTYTGQLQVTATTTLATSEGNVGVGTTTPSTLFTVATSTDIFNVTNYGYVGIGTASPVNILDVGGGMAVGATYSGTSVAPSNGMIIEGNVGIGTSTPVAVLDVYAATDTTAFLFEQDGTGSILDIQNATGSVFAIDNTGHIAMTGNLTATGNIVGANITVASTSAWDIAQGIVTSSSTDWNTAYNTINASSTNWDTSYTWLVASSTPWEQTYNYFTASSSNWETAYSWGNHATFGYLAASNQNWVDSGSSLYSSSTFTYIGIGTTTPDAILNVYASATTTALLVEQDGTGSILDIQNATGSVFAIDNTGHIAMTGNLTATGNIVGANITVASTSAWDIAQGIVTASSTDWNTAYNTINASSSEWSGAFSWLIASSTPWEQTYNYFTASSSNWETSYTWLVASSTNWATAYGWGDHSLAGYLYPSGQNWFGSGPVLYSSTTFNQIGIGTSTPIAMLDVYAATDTTAFLFEQDSTGSILDIQNATGSVFAIDNTGHITMTGNLTATGNIVGANISVASSSAWDIAQGIVTASSTDWNTAFNTINASSTNWDTSYTWLVASSTPWEQTYNYFTASSSNWETAYSWGNHATFGYLAASNQNWVDSGSSLYSSSTFTYIGIGTTTPDAILNVYASATTTALLVEQDGTGSILDIQNATGSVFAIDNTGHITMTGNLTATGNIVGANITVASSSAWDIAQGIVTASSTDWNTAYNTINASSSEWSGAFSWLIASSTPWEQTYNYFTASSSNWETSYTWLTASSTDWATAYGWGNHSLAGYLYPSGQNWFGSGPVLYSSTTFNQIGIGTSTPIAMLDVYAATDTTAFLFEQDSTGAILDIQNATGSVLTIDNGGNLTVTGNILGSGNIVLTGDTATSSIASPFYTQATTTLGSSTSTPTILTGYIQSDIIPYSADTYNIGSSDYGWQNIYAAKINQVLYVHAGDGADIQTKIDSCSNNCRIIIPVGNYSYTTTPIISGKESIIIEGQGPGTILKPSGDIDGFQVSSSTRITLRNFTIDGVDLTASATERIALYATSTSESIFERLAIKNWLIMNWGAHDAIRLDHSSKNIIQNNYIYNISEGILLANDSDDNQILSNYIDRIGYNSTLYGQDGLETAGGFDLAGVSATSSNNVFAYNYVGQWTPGNSGMDNYLAADGTQIIGNTFEGNGGIWIGQGSTTPYTIVKGNIVRDANAVQSVLLGINGNSDYAVISGNTIINSGGITMGESKFVSIIGNTIKDSLNYGIWAGGYSNTVSNNTIDGTYYAGIKVGDKSSVTGNTILGAGTALDGNSIGIAIGSDSIVSGNFVDAYITASASTVSPISDQYTANEATINGNIFQNFSSNSITPLQIRRSGFSDIDIIKYDDVVTGVSSNQARFTLTGNRYAGATDYDFGIRMVNNPGGNASSIQFLNAEYNSAWRSLLVDNAGNTIIYSGVNTAAMYIDTSQKVGIGTSTPSSVLDVYANSANTALLIEQDSTGAILDIQNATGTVLSIDNAGNLTVDTDTFYVDASNNAVAIGTTTAAGVFTVGTSTPMFNITTEGNVGIGTAGPGYKLTVNGDGYLTSALTADIYGGFAPQRTNLATYSSFETPLGSTPTGWTFQDGGTGGSAVVSADEQKHGSYSVKITNINSPYINVNQAVAISSSTQYTVSVWVKTSVTNVMYIYATDGTTVWTSSYHTGDGTWQRLSLTFTTGDAATWLLVKLENNAGVGSAYWDAVQVEAGSSAYAYIPTEVSTTTRSSGLSTSQDLTAYGNAYFGIYSGSVGIGTTTPSALLDVYASSTAYALSVNQQMTGGIANFQNATGSVFAIDNTGHIAMTGNLTATGNIVGANITTASSSAWDIAQGIVTSSSTDWNTAFNTINASSSNWDTAYTWLVASSTPWEQTYNYFTASSSNWETAYTWIVASSSDWSDTEFDPVFVASSTDYVPWASASTSAWDIAYGWGDHSLAGYLYPSGQNWFGSGPVLYSSTTFNQIGIGTSTPVAMLDVYAATDTTAFLFEQDSTGAILDIQNATGTVFYIDNAGNLTVDTDTFYVDASNNAVAIGTTTAAGVFTVGTSTTAMFNITTEGNVGIGTTSPTEALHVIGNVRVSGAYTYTSRGGLAAGTGSTDMRVWGANNLELYGGSDASKNILLNPAGTGNVGIGTTGPVEKLDVSFGNMRLGQAPTTYTTSNEDMDASTTTVPVVSTDEYPSAGTLLLDSEAVTYTSKTATTFDSVVRGALGTTAGTHTSGATVKNYILTAIATSTKPLMVLTGDGYLAIGTSTQAGVFTVGTTTTAMFNITTEGKVGIGMANPTYPLDISFGNGIIRTSGSEGQVMIVNTLTNNTWQIGENVGGQGTGKLSLWNSLGQAFNLIQTGEVGMGTSSPLAALHLYTATTGTAVLFEQDSTGSILDIQNATGSVFAIDNTGHITMTGNLTATGNIVGANISVASSSAWDIAQGIVTASSTDWNTAYNTINASSSEWSGAFSWLTASSTPWEQTYNYFTASSSNWETSYTWLVASSTNWATAYGWGDHSLAGYLYPSGQNWFGSGPVLYSSTTFNQIGIGTTTPIAMLDVYAATDTTAFLFEQDSTGAILDIQNATGTVLAIDNAGNLTSGSTFYVDQANKAVAVGTTTAAGVFTVGTSTTAMFNITTEGYVGIGTTAPGAKLDVVGNIKVSPYSSIYGSYISEKSLNSADNTTNWSATGLTGFTTDTTNKKEGSASLTGNYPVSTTSWARFYSTNDFGNLTDFSNNDDFFEFWLYISDASLFTLGSIEIGNTQDTAEYGWGNGHLPTLANGWNKIVLRMGDATQQSVDWSTGVDHFRIYFQSTGTNPEFTVKIDDLKMVSNRKSSVNRLVYAEDKILTMGSVGIGTTGPVETLDLSGNLRLGLAPTTYTTTTEDISSASTTIPITSTDEYPSVGTLLIGTEAITYTGKDTTNFTGATRAALGTTAAVSTAGTTVKNYLFTAIATSTTPRMVILGDGNVGIGTTGPEQTLHIRGDSTSGNVRIDHSNQNTGIDGSLATAGTRIKEIDFYYSGTAPNAVIAKISAINYNNSGTGWYNIEDRYKAGLSFFTTHQNNLQERLTIKSDGNVGIGTTTPSAVLDVYASTTGTTAALLVEQDGTGSILDIQNATGSVLTIDNAGNLTVDTDVLYVDASNKGVAVGTTTAAGVFTVGTSTTAMFNITTEGNVGIGTTNPQTQLHLASGNGLIVTQGADANTTYVRVLAEGDVGKVAAWDNDFGARNLALNPSGGNVGIGTTNPGAKLTITDAQGGANANFNFSGNVTGGYTSTISLDDTGLKISHNSGSRDIRVVAGTGGVVLAAGATAWAAISDERLKDILAPLDNGIEKLMGLRTIYYKLKSDSSDTRRVGLIAQDVQKVLPEAVSADANGYLSLRYTELIPPIIKAIQEQQAQIENISGLGMGNGIAISGNVGIGTTTPSSVLDVYANGAATALLVEQDGTGAILDIQNATGTVLSIDNGGNLTSGSTFYVDQANNGVAVGTTTAAGVFTVGTTTEPMFVITTEGYLGIATSSPARRVEVLDTANPQIRISQSGPDYGEFLMDANGDLTISASGGDIQMLYESLWVCEAGGCGITLSGTGNLVVENYTYLSGSKLTYPSELGRPKRSIILTAAGGITPSTLGATQTKVDGTYHTYYVLDYAAATTSSVYWQWVMPDSFATGTVDVTIYWETASDTGSVVWGIDTAGVKADSAEDIDPALGSAATTSNAAEANVNDLGSVTISNYADGVWDPGDYIIFKVYRNGESGDDTIGAAARLVKVKIEYNVMQETD